MRIYIVSLCIGSALITNIINSLLNYKKGYQIHYTLYLYFIGWNLCLYIPIHDRGKATKIDMISYLFYSCELKRYTCNKYKKTRCYSRCMHYDFRSMYIYLTSLLQHTFSIYMDLHPIERKQSITTSNWQQDRVKGIFRWSYSSS